MAVEVKMPQLGESVFEGTIGKWLKEEGDTVEKYEPLLEVVTDKVDTEVTAVESGTVLAILVPEGETVTVGTVLAVIGEAGEDVTQKAAAVAAPPAPAEAPSPEAASPRASPVAARVAADKGVDLASLTGTGPGGQVTRRDVEEAAAGAGLGFISPRVARLAAEEGVDLRLVEGTGRGGRITARDVEQFIAAGTPAAAAPAPAREVAAGRSAIAAGDLVKMTPMRAAIAEHMVRSKHTAPHVTTVHEVDMGAVMAAYAELRGPYASQGVRLTITAFIVKATAEALAAHPIVNSTWTDEGIRTFRDVNIGLAVAVPEGLIVPVIRNADGKSLRGLSRDIGDLADRARNKKLLPDEVQGATFTLTNYGTLGSLFGTPVISQPQAAILGAGAIKKRPVVVEGPAGDSIGIRPMMFLALTFDHRILDGGSADPFMQDIVARLEGFKA